MKTLAKILALAMIACLVTSCEKDPADHSNPLVNKAVPTFEAEFVVSDASDLPQGKMNGQYKDNSTECLRTWVGAGESALMGEISVKMSLLCNPSDLSFYNLIGTFETEDGSVLFFSIEEGQMECNTGEHFNYYDYTFNNLAVINGGTGRFAGAKGSFYPNAMIHNAQGSAWNARFCCKGDIQILSPRQPAAGELVYEP